MHACIYIPAEDARGLKYAEELEKAQQTNEADRPEHARVEVVASKDVRRHQEVKRQDGDNIQRQPTACITLENL